MGALIITTLSEADTLVIEEVARRFGCKVALRFGDFHFVDAAAGSSKVMSATGKVEVQQGHHPATKKGLGELSTENKSIQRQLKKHRR